MDAGECLGAVYAMLNMSEALPEPLKACPPADTQPDQGVRAVVLISRTDRSEVAKTS
jgi:hypothetical protein